MDNEPDLEFPPPKRIRLEGPEPEILTDTLLPPNGPDDLSNSRPLHVNNSKGFSFDTILSQSDTLPPAIPGISMLDDLKPSETVSEPHERAERATESDPTSAIVLQDTDLDDVYMKDMSTPKEGQTILTSEEFYPTTEEVKSGPSLIDSDQPTAKAVTEGQASPAKEEEAQALAIPESDEKVQEILVGVNNKFTPAEVQDDKFAISEVQGSKDIVPTVNVEMQKEAFTEESVPQDTKAGTGQNLIEIKKSDLSLGEASSTIATSEQLAGACKSSAEAEFELDSSPYESSSSDSSTDTSSSESDVEDYEMLSPEEEARRLMAEDGGAEEKATSGVPRTVNEKPDEVVPIPDVTITADMKLEELGRVENLVENLALIKANTSGEYQVLEAGSVLCLEERKVIGVVAETLGRVQQPYYSVCFTNAAAMSEAGIAKDTKVYYVSQFATTVFTQPLKAFKGSDASNMHDEEVGDEELEFSDDEAEAEHKRQAKLQKRARIDSKRGQGDGFSRGPQQRSGRPHHHNNERSLTGSKHPPNSTEQSLNYDDVVDDDDGLYTPLSRPSASHEMMAYKDEFITAHRGGRGRGRGDRGDGRRRHRGNRGGGPGGNSDRRNQNSQREDNHSRARESSGQQPSQRPQDNAFDLSGGNLPPRPSYQNDSLNSHIQPHYSRAEPQLHPTHSSSQPHSHPGYTPQYHQSYDQSYQQHYQQSQYPQNAYQNHFSQQAYPTSPQYLTPSAPSSSTAIPPGAHINPNFFRQQAQSSPQSWHQQQQQQQPYYPQQQYQQHQQYQQPSSISGNAGPLSPNAARKLQESLDKLKGLNGGGGAHI